MVALARNNLNTGAGYIERFGTQYLIRSPGQLAKLEDIHNISVAIRDDVSMMLYDVAEIKIGNELRNEAVTQDDKEVVLGNVFTLIGENSRQVAWATAESLERIKPFLSEEVKLNVLYVRTSLVDKTIAAVQKNLSEAVLLVIVVLLLLLGNWRAALITVAVIPMAMLMDCTEMVPDSCVQKPDEPGSAWFWFY